MDKDLTTKNVLKEEIPIRWAQEEPAEFLQKFVAKLQSLNKILSKNSYVKETTKVLNYIIKDAMNSPIILLAGITGTGKTSLINALLRRPILSPKIEVTTAVNCIICFGEKEEVRAHFFDGQVASFDIDKVELFTSLDTSSARILREGLDFIEIYVNNELLKIITLIDTTPLQLSGKETAYIKESILNRADDIFWVFKYGQRFVPEELKLIEKLKEKRLTPLGIVNGIDLIESEENKQLSTYEKELKKYVRATVSVSAKEAQEAIVEQDSEKWQHSQMDLLLEELKKAANNHQRRLAFIAERFIHWLNRFQTELEIIQEREPYKSSYQIVKDYAENFESIETEKVIQNKQISKLTSLYEETSNIFKEVETLYQLIHVIVENSYLTKNGQLSAFKEKANQYLLTVREYRKLYHHYMEEYEILEKNHQKTNGKSLFKYLFGNNKEDDGYYKDEIEKLNFKQQIIEKKYNSILLEEENLLKSFDEIRELFNQLIKEKLASILKEFSSLRFERSSQDSKIQKAVRRLAGFNSIVEAQTFLLKFVKECVLSGEIVLTKEQEEKIKHTLQAIENVNLDYQVYVDQWKQGKPISHEKIQSMVEEKNPFYPLKMTTNDIRVKIEEPPKLIEMNNE